MARLQVLNSRSAAMMCIVSGVTMPDGTKRDYMETGKNALAHIYEQIRLDRALIRLWSRVKAKSTMPGPCSPA